MPLPVGAYAPPLTCRYAQLYREGARCACFYVLAKGRLQHATLTATLKEASGGGGHGHHHHSNVPESLSREMAVSGSGVTASVMEVAGGVGCVGVCFGLESLTGMLRATTVAALEQCELLRFESGMMQEGGEASPGQAKIVSRVFEMYVEAELRAMPLFDGLSKASMDELVKLFALQEITQSNLPIFREGDAGDKFYVLLHGRVSVVAGEGDAALTLAVLDANADSIDGYPFFGEMALMDGKARMAGVFTHSSQCKLLVLEKRNFGEFLRIMPDFKARLRRIKELRKRESELNRDNADRRATAPKTAREALQQAEDRKARHEELTLEKERRASEMSRAKSLSRIKESQQLSGVDECSPGGVRAGRRRRTRSGGVRPEGMTEEEDMHDAASTIQAHARGRAARHKVDAGRRKVSEGDRGFAKQPTFARAMVTRGNTVLGLSEHVPD